MSWLDHVRADPRPWLLDEAVPAVRAAALQRLEGRPADDPDVVAARRAAMEADPIRAILAAQDPVGFWVQPGPGYGPKYRGTVWQVVFFDQLGVDPLHPRSCGPATTCCAGARRRRAGSAARPRRRRLPRRRRR